ncbi:hypothetical protein VNO77_08480 [Canavalia gladiata]|uniref:Uncharacterized protein n=1 Tax=Canavalia gladiata TaxID=3824 RepID=A0AAN9QX23_CANGL
MLTYPFYDPHSPLGYSRAAWSTFGRYPELHLIPIETFDSRIFKIFKAHQIHVQLSDIWQATSLGSLLDRLNPCLCVAPRKNRPHNTILLVSCFVGLAVHPPVRGHPNFVHFIPIDMIHFRTGQLLPLDGQ